MNHCKHLHFRNKCAQRNEPVEDSCLQEVTGREIFQNHIHSESSRCYFDIVLLLRTPSVSWVRGNNTSRVRPGQRRGGVYRERIPKTDCAVPSSRCGMVDTALTFQIIVEGSSTMAAAMWISRRCMANKLKAFGVALCRRRSDVH